MKKIFMNKVANRLLYTSSLSILLVSNLMAKSHTVYQTQLPSGSIEFIKTGEFNKGASLIPNTTSNAGTGIDGAGVVGDVITYKYSLKNVGDIAISKAVIDDTGVTAKYISGDLNQNNIIDKGEIWIYESKYSIKQADIDNGEVISQASVKVTNTSGEVLSKLSGTNATNLASTKVELPFGGVLPDFCPEDFSQNKGDSFIGGFHQSIIKTRYGFETFGEGASVDYKPAYTPTKIIPANGFAFKGSPLMASLGVQGTYVNDSRYPFLYQAVLLTTNGLYSWGRLRGIFHPDTNGTNNNEKFHKISLPSGVSPYDIVDMQATYKGMSLLTKEGKVYTAGYNFNLFGDGTSTYDAGWHIVQNSTGGDLTNVKSVRMHYNGALALTNDNKLYTWGIVRFLGGGTNYSTHTTGSKAVQMTLPNVTDLKIKQIAITGDNYTGAEAPNFNSIYLTYYLLGDNGKMYSLGSNHKGQLGIGSFDYNNNWQVVKDKNRKELQDVVFITSNDNSAYFAMGGAITKHGRYYVMGDNYGGTMGQVEATSSAVSLAREPQGTTDVNGNLIKRMVYAELGGHLNMVIAEDLKFCYVGHKVYGSMGDGTTANATVSKFDCENTPHIAELCVNLEIEPEPGLHIVKDGVFTSKSTDGIAKVGDNIEYTLTVTNSGNVTLNNIALKDPKVPTFQGQLTKLNAGEKGEFKFNYTITQEDIEKGGVFNLVSGEADIAGVTAYKEKKNSIPKERISPIDSKYPIASDKEKACYDCTITVIPQHPNITVIKRGTLSVNPKWVKEGDKITYTFDVKNTGNVALKSVELIDALLPNLKGTYTLNQGVLAVGESWSVSEEYTLTKEDINKREVLNTVDVSGMSVKGIKAVGNSSITTAFGNSGLIISNRNIYHKAK